MAKLCVPIVVDWDDIKDHVAKFEKHGRWEYTDYGGVGNWHCSVCHNIVVGAKGASLRTPYCPNCGAKMDGEDNG